MICKTYQASTVEQALAEVKRDLGRDAIILKARTVRKGGIIGIGGRRIWQVMASPDAQVPTRKKSGQYISMRSGSFDNAAAALEAMATQTIVLDCPAQIDPHEALACEGSASPQLASEPATEKIERHLGELRQMVQSLTSAHAPPLVQQAMPVHLQEFHTHLLRQDVDESIVTDLMDQLKLSLSGDEHLDAKVIADRLCDLIASRINVVDAGPPKSRIGKPYVIALIGPTGVGKTTTIAKLAANLKLHQHRKVGLVTIDTYRIAAVDQLRTYAEIIEVPLRTVLSAGELHQAVYGLENVDTVLIDTAGRSQNDGPRLNELRIFLAAAQADEIHLVLSANASIRCIKNAIDQFGPLGAKTIMLTKLDEAESYGTILSLSAGQAGPLSFVTTGQDVPDDIEAADPWRLAQRIMKGRI